MNQLALCYTADALEANGQITAGGNTLIIDQQEFVPKVTFAKHLLNDAIAICERFRSQGIYCLVVENQYASTVWVTKQTHTEPSGPISRHAISTTSQPTAQSATAQGDAQSETYVYRGKVYQKSKSAAQQTPVEEKKARMYRGRTY